MSFNSYGGSHPPRAPGAPPPGMGDGEVSNPRYKRKQQEMHEPLGAELGAPETAMDLLDLGAPPRPSGRASSTRRKTYAEAQRTTCWKPLAIVLCLLVLGLIAVIVLVMLGQLDIFDLFKLQEDEDATNST